MSDPRLLLLVVGLGVLLVRGSPHRRNPAPVGSSQATKRLMWRAHKQAQRANICRHGKEAHHADYNHPLEVECLTPKQHDALHEGGVHRVKARKGGASRARPRELTGRERPYKRPADLPF